MNNAKYREAREKRENFVFSFYPLTLSLSQFFFTLFLSSFSSPSIFQRKVKGCVLIYHQLVETLSGIYQLSMIYCTGDSL